MSNFHYVPIPFGMNEFECMVCIFHTAFVKAAKGKIVKTRQEIWDELIGKRCYIDKTMQSWFADYLFDVRVKLRLQYRPKKNVIKVVRYMQYGCDSCDWSESYKTIAELLKNVSYNCQLTNAA